MFVLLPGVTLACPSLVDCEAGCAHVSASARCCHKPSLKACQVTLLHALRTYAAAPVVSDRMADLLVSGQASGWRLQERVLLRGSPGPPRSSFREG